MREVLATYTGQSPAHLRFDYGASGKPSLADDLGVRPHFNLSHTVDLAALAITVDHPLGVDIERVRPLKEDIAGRFFSPAEVAALGALPVDARETAFYRCWTRKEAFVKATGHGLGFPLDSFDVTLTADAPAILRIAGQSPQQVALWRLLHFDAAPGVVGAIALRSTQPDDRVNLRLRR